MKRLLFNAVFAAVFMTLVSCATTEKTLRDKGLAPLSHSELQALHARTRTLKGTNANGVRGAGTYTTDGVAKLDWGTGEATGTWRIKDGKFCTTYSTVQSGAERCFTVYKTAENEYTSFNPDGSLNATASYTD